MSVENNECLGPCREAKSPEPFPQTLSWGIIVLGLTLDIWVKCVAMIVDWLFLDAARAHIAFAKLPYLLVAQIDPVRLMLNLWMSLPFICLATIGRRRLNATSNHDTLYCKAVGLIGAGVVPLALCVGLYRNLYSLIGTEPEFGMGLEILAVHMVLGTWSIISMPIGYVCGYMVGKSLLFMRCWRQKTMVTY
jgi:hypothetical protein